MAAAAAPALSRRMVPVTEAAVVLDVSEDTLVRAGDAGEIPMVRIRSKRLLPLAWLDHVTSWPREVA